MNISISAYLIGTIFTGAILGYVSGAIAGYIGGYFSPLARIMDKSTQETIGYNGAENGQKVGIFTGIIGAFYVSGTIGILQNISILFIVLLLFCILAGYSASYIARNGKQSFVGLEEGSTCGAWLGAIGGYAGSYIALTIWNIF